MALLENEKFDIGRIQKKMNISVKSIENLPISRNELEKIYNDFKKSREGRLDPIRAEILKILNAKLTEKVHSVRCRIKDPDHLIEKIIRNMNRNPGKYSALRLDNYNKIITDLIGVRIIILDKRDWKEVHESLLNIFRNLPERYVDSPEDIVSNYDKYDREANEDGKGLDNSYHAEKPVVYVMSEEDRVLYADENLKVDTSKTHYRSLHYIIRYRFVYFEIQVRTLFEEGWLEFDHRIKYPYDQNNMRKQEFAGILNSLAVAADRLISFYEEEDFRQENGDKANSDLQEVRRLAGETADGQTLNDKMIKMF